MRTRIANHVTFFLERYLVRGAHYQLLAVAGMIGLVAVIAGLALRFGVGGLGTEESMWWAFLRLSDPGYLGDDTGALQRTIATVVTVLGYVLFMGSLVAIMTQWLNATMRRLEAGYTPVVRKNHVLLLGWTGRAGIVVNDLLLSEGRVRRFLRRRGARRLHIVLLAEEVGASLLQELKERTDERWDPRTITLRSGTPLRSDHLERVDFLRAGVILLPAGEFAAEGPDGVDTRTIKALLSISRHPAVEDVDELPLAVVELFDARKAAIAARAYAGRVEVLASDAIVSRLIAQNVRHRGLSHVFNEVFTHAEGNELFVRDAPADLAGARVADVIDSWPDAIVLGVVRDRVPLLDPAADVTVEDGDKLVFLARDHADTEPRARRPGPRQTAPAAGSAEADEGGGERAPRSLLLLGWSHRAPALVAELARYGETGTELTVVSAVAPEERAAALAHYGPSGSSIAVEQIELDYTVPDALARLDPARFDHIVMLGSDWLDSGEESDARTIVGYLILGELLAGAARRPQVIVELLDPENVGLLGRDRSEVLLSPVILSHMLAQVALRPELNAVFTELFTPGGAEIAFRSGAAYGLDGEATFAAVRAAVHARGDIALGVRPAGGLPELNPGREETYALGGGAEVIVLVTH